MKSGNQMESVDALRLPLIGSIVEARQAAGLSQRQLADLCGVKQPIIARLEKGSTSPQLDTVLKVLAALGYTLAIVPIKGSNE